MKSLSTFYRKIGLFREVTEILVLWLKRQGKHSNDAQLLV